MKTRTAVIAAAIFIAVSTGFSKEPAKRFLTIEQKIESAKRNLMVALKMDNTGAVEAAMRMVAQIKLEYPATDVSALKETLDEMAVENPSGITRYKAYIVSAVCAEPEWYSQDQNIVKADQDQFFKAASTRLAQKLVSSNTY